MSHSIQPSASQSSSPTSERHTILDVEPGINSRIPSMLFSRPSCPQCDYFLDPTSGGKWQCRRCGYLITCCD